MEWNGAKESDDLNLMTTKTLFNTNTFLVPFNQKQ